ncbi:hypothetical protein DSO57_1002500 [Entomophthora muscae]|uniref:Uncharacterized protein n=1 Tax=Entomophthora muscae TaxID=34485 RepID=A0ACC2SLP3_9FUNG|nr:hypothetical protein DSO57_1002500 [Entomophthora muscae]
MIYILYIHSGAKKQCLSIVQNIPNTYSHLINAQILTVTEKTSVTNIKTSTSTKPLFTTTTQKLTTKLLPAVNMQTPTATKLLSAANAQTPTVTKKMSTATKKIHTITVWKPAIIKLLPATNVQTSAAIEQMHTATVQAPTTLASPT